MSQRQGEKEKHWLRTAHASCYVCTQPWWTMDTAMRQCWGNAGLSWENSSNKITGTTVQLIDNVLTFSFWSIQLLAVAEIVSVSDERFRHLGASSLGQDCKEVWLWYCPSWDSSLSFSLFLPFVGDRMLTKRLPHYVVQQPLRYQITELK